LAEAYQKSIQEELSLTEEQKKTRHVGKQDPKRHIEEASDQLLKTNISQSVSTLINAISL
jgi:26S proteasome regulatory subunit N11